MSILNDNFEEPVIESETPFAIEVIPVNAMAAAKDLITALDDMDSALTAQASGCITLQQDALLHNIDVLGMDVYCNLYRGKPGDYTLQNQGAIIAGGVAAAVAAVALIVWKIRSWWKNRGAESADKHSDNLDKIEASAKNMTPNLKLATSYREQLRNNYDKAIKEGVDKKVIKMAKPIFPINQPQHEFFKNVVTGKIKVPELLTLPIIALKAINDCNKYTSDLDSKRFDKLDDFISSVCKTGIDEVFEILGVDLPSDNSLTLDGISSRQKAFDTWKCDNLTHSDANLVTMKEVSAFAVSRGAFDRGIKELKEAAVRIDPKAAKKIAEKAKRDGWLGSENREGKNAVDAWGAAEKLVRDIIAVINSAVVPSCMTLFACTTHRDLVPTLAECVDLIKRD